mgnify:CR=1 FL=1
MRSLSVTVLSKSVPTAFADVAPEFKNLIEPSYSVTTAPYPLLFELSAFVSHIIGSPPCAEPVYVFVSLIYLFLNLFPFATPALNSVVNSVVSG